MHRKDLVNITIRKIIGYSEQIVGVGKGSFLEQIKYEGDDEPFWTINDSIGRLTWDEVEPYLKLASDSSVREDALHIQEEAWEEAEAAKHELEQVQRNDKKLRETAQQAREMRQ